MTETKCRIAVSQLNSKKDGFIYWAMRLKTGEWKIGQYTKDNKFVGYVEKF